MAANVSRERKKIIEAFGATPIYSDPMKSSDGAIEQCREIIRENRSLLQARPVQQRSELARALRNHRARIWRQTRGEVTHFIAGIGTSGTLMGTGRYRSR